jgi:hypothetical protein
MRRQHLIHIALAAVVIATQCPATLAGQTEEQPVQAPSKPVFNNAQDYLTFFRQGGEHYDSPPTGLMNGSRPNPAAMKALGAALLTDNEEVRTKIIRLLREASYLDNRYELRQPEIIALLVGPGFARPDSARSDAMGLLLRYASASTLARHGAALLKELQQRPDETLFLLIAKAKPKGAWQEVQRLSALPEWSLSGSRGETLRIARAALGDTQLEDEYLDALKRANSRALEEGAMPRSPEFFAPASPLEGKPVILGVGEQGLWSHLGPPMYIGTRRSLQAVCRYLRSPLIIHIPGLEDRSIRLTVMQILSSAFPEQRDLLDPSNVLSDADYLRAEAFCERATGVRYDDLPRPEFFTSRPYPQFFRSP